MTPLEELEKFIHGIYGYEWASHKRHIYIKHAVYMNWYFNHYTEIKNSITGSKSLYCPELCLQTLIDKGQRIEFYPYGIVVETR